MGNNYTKASEEELAEIHEKIKRDPLGFKNVNALCRHDDGRLFLATSHAPGATFWYPNGKIGFMQGIFHNLVLIAERNDKGVFVNIDYDNKQETPAEPVKPTPAKPRQVERMAKHQKTLSNVLNPAPVAAPQTPPAPPVDDSGFQSFSEFVDLRFVNRNELFLTFGMHGHVIVPKGLELLIGDKPYEFQINTSKRLIRIIIGSGPLALSKTRKHNFIGAIRIIHTARGMTGDPQKESIGRIPLTVIQPGVLEGEY